MYLPIPKGSVEIIQGYECQLPPVGYGKNRFTGELQYVGVRSISSKTSEQMWKPIFLPKDWKERRKNEERKKDAEKENGVEYFDESLEAIRDKWWLHRYCGEWVMINGKEVYIVGSHWYYMNCCVIDIGLPNYRDSDRKLFYVWEYCVEDPRCAGLLEVERRRMGKTYKAGSILLDRSTMFANHHAGIQSKTLSAAKNDVFAKAVVSVFKKLPDFFMPSYDKAKGLTPTTELRFFNTTIKGNKSDDAKEGEELESWIDFGPSNKFHYDGSKLLSFCQDEWGKSIEENVYDRWEVVKYCLDQDGVWVGKSIHTSTIEEMESGGDNALKLWQDSDESTRNEIGRTTTGLYQFFLPAYETMKFDKYGMPNVSEATQYYQSIRAGLINDARALNSHIRKNPFTILEAFRIDGEDCLYNSGKLNDRLDVLQWNDDITTRGNFIWENGERDTKVIWEKNPSGRWEVCWLPKEEDSNKIKKVSDGFCPDNNLRFVIGADPFSHDTTKDKRRSDGAAIVLKKPDSHDSDKTFENAFVCKYLARPEQASIYYEDLIKMCVYFGCSILIENNKNNWKQYFIDRKYHAFLMYLPGQTEPGVHANPNTHQELAEITEEYIEEHIGKVFFKKLITDWLKFKINNTTAFDIAMAAGWCLLAARKRIYRESATPTEKIDQIFRKYKIRA